MQQQAHQQEYPPQEDPPEAYGPPPAQQQQYGYAQVPPSDYTDEKVSFEQAFKVEKPRYNDIWAGILFLMTMAGYVAVSGIAIQGYGTICLLFAPAPTPSPLLLLPCIVSLG